MRHVLRKGTYEIAGHQIEVRRDIGTGEVLFARDFLVDGKEETSDEMSGAMVFAHGIWRLMMPDYNKLLARIAIYLVNEYGVATDLSDEAAAKLVRECELSTILVKGIATRALGESPRQTFSGEAKTL